MDDPAPPRITRLASGLTVATRRIPSLRTAAVYVQAPTGSRYESAAENGLAHLFEHMVFKGTATRSAKDIAEEMENVGGALNAWTGRDRTVFHARALAEHAALALDLIGDMLLNPRFAGDDLAQEKKVVLSEIGEALDAPDDLVFDLLQDAAYPAQPIGRPILGTPPSVGAFSPESLRNWQAQHYRAEDIIVTAAGAVRHDAIVRQTEALFAPTPSGHQPPATPARWAGGARATARPAEQTHVALAFTSPARAAPERSAALLFATALGGGTSSRLFQELREERGLAYSVSAYLTGYADSGMLSLYAAVDPPDAEETLDRMRGIARTLAADITPHELARAKAQVKVALLTGLEGADAQADWMGRSLQVYGRILTEDELVARIEATTLDAVRAAAAATLASHEARAVVGPNAERFS